MRSCFVILLLSQSVTKRCRAMRRSCWRKATCCTCPRAARTTAIVRVSQLGATPPTCDEHRDCDTCAAAPDAFKGTRWSSFSDTVAHLRRCQGRACSEDEHVVDSFGIPNAERGKGQYVHDLAPPLDGFTPVVLERAEAAAVAAVVAAVVEG